MEAPTKSRSPHAWFGFIVAGLLIYMLAVAAWPSIVPGKIPGPRPDAEEYAHLANALLHGSYRVSIDGEAPRVTRYSLGFPIMLMPAVALGGLEAAVWISYLSALALGALAALIAARIGGGVAAPVAVVLVLFTSAVTGLSTMVMSDIPAAAVGLGELALLALTSGRRSAAGAGVLAAVLVWMRPAAIVLVVAGFAGLWGSMAFRQRIGAYFGGLMPLLVLLAIWQWFAYGSPLTTSYQWFAGDSGLHRFFSPGYVIGSPSNTYAVGDTPNALAYARSLLGIDSIGAWLGTGLLGLVGAAVMARSTGADGIVGRFTLATNALMLLVYLPYFFQDQRFLLFSEVLNSVVAAAVIAGAMAALRRRLPVLQRTR